MLVQPTNLTQLTQWSGNNQTMAVKIDMIATYGNPFPMPVGARFIARVQDNFSGLINFTITLQGKEIK